MANSGEVPSQALMTLPAWLGNGDPAQLLSQAGLRSKRVADRDDLWQVQTEESYLRVRPRLVVVDHLAGPGQAVTRFEQLATVSGVDQYAGSALSDVDEVRTRFERAAQTKQPVDYFNALRIQTMLAPVAQLSGVVSDVYQGLLAMGMEGDRDHKVLANAGVHLVRRDERLSLRAKLSSLGIRIVHDERLRGGETDHLKDLLAGGKTIFASGDGLYAPGLLFLDGYLGPLLGALSPWVWGFSAHRTARAVVYSLGQPLAGARGEATELLQLLSQPGATETIPPVTLPAEASTAAVEWWVSKLNLMFGVLSDPAVFTDSAGIYNPAAQLRGLLTVDQLFRRVYSIQTTHRDTNARRVLLFTVMDTLLTLTGRPLVKHCSLPFARKTLGRIQADMPSAAATVLIPAAERALVALETVQDGFFLGRHAGNASSVDLVYSAGGGESLAASDAAAHYLDVLRNATHGYGTGKSGRVDRTTALLAHHNGDISHDLGLLGYVYLLDLLANPEVLRRILHRASSEK